MSEHQQDDTRTEEEKRRAPAQPIADQGRRTPEEEQAWAERQARENAERSEGGVRAAREGGGADTKPVEPMPDQRGGQIILEPDSEASRAARGTMYPDQVLNDAAYQTEKDRLEAEQKVADAKARLEQAQADLEQAEAARGERSGGHPQPARP